ncbi:hypothetical protein V1477_009836 [Vespula maculifrons]|uniref:Uncharacterized protein n=1 Tax=Vespula maculifrons TaxID=7453 RepID=A0ABD2CAX5_VESMC
MYTEAVILNNSCYGIHVKICVNTSGVLALKRIAGIGKSVRSTYAGVLLYPEPTMSLLPTIFRQYPEIVLYSSPLDCTPPTVCSACDFSDRYGQNMNYELNRETLLSLCAYCIDT